jgi:hypothetical protein
MPGTHEYPGKSGGNMKNILLLLLAASFAWAGGGQESDADILNQDWDSIVAQARGA